MFDAGTKCVAVKILSRRILTMPEALKPGIFPDNIDKFYAVVISTALYVNWPGLLSNITQIHKIGSFNVYGILRC